jgi:hypothetical protein
MALPGLTSPRLAGGETIHDLDTWLDDSRHLHVDLGTGDGRFAVDLARSRPDLAVLGVDTNLDALPGPRQRLPANVRFARADAREAPVYSRGAVSVSVNFPYGSLLRGLVEGDVALLARLDCLLARPGRLEIRVNARALTGTGLDPAGAERAIVRSLRELDGMRVSSRPLAQAELRAFPSAWAKRLGYGRPADAFLVTAVR